MAEVRRVRAIWTGVPGTPYISTWWFENQVGQVGAISTAVRTFLTACCTQIRTDLKVDLEADQSVFNAETGDLIGIESQTAGATIAGTGSATPIPAADQYVLRLATGGIVNNRRVRGRFFVPGVPQSNMALGAPTSATMTALNTAGAGLITGTATAGKWVVYSRPVEAGAGGAAGPEPRAGSIHTVQAASCWSKFGVQRRRRD